MTPGLAVLAAALALAVAGGGLWRHRNGRMRAPRGGRAIGPGAFPPGQAVAAAGVPGLLSTAGSNRGPGSPPTADPPSTPGPHSTAGPRLTADPGRPAAGRAVSGPLSLSAELLGHPLGERATLVQFSSAFCAPCRATRRVLADVAHMTSGVAHVEIDAESRLDLVRQVGVVRTPTVLVLAADGRVVRRASGQPRKPDVIAAIGEAVGL